MYWHFSLIASNVIFFLFLHHCTLCHLVGKIDPWKTLTYVLMNRFKSCYFCWTKVAWTTTKAWSKCMNFWWGVAAVQLSIIGYSYYIYCQAEMMIVIILLLPALLPHLLSPLFFSLDCAHELWSPGGVPISPWMTSSKVAEWTLC